MFITTAGRTTAEMIKEAESYAEDLGIPYISRNKISIQMLQMTYQSDCLVVGKERLELFQYMNPNPFFFHPNSAMFRIKRLLLGEKDPFIEVTQLAPSKTLLDCTLGLASDSIVASFIVGNQGKVVGIEMEKYVSTIVSSGLQSWDSRNSDMNMAMKNIEVVTSNSLDYLRNLRDESFDCVYFDPMFEDRIEESDGMKGLHSFANYESLSDELISEAKRVARERVVLKDHYLSSRFERFGFHVYKRKTSKFHFGEIVKQ